jgi:hypothetical protein
LTGANIGAAATLWRMTDEYTPPDALDELVGQLLDIGGVFSQIIDRMVQFEASGRSTPDAVPVPEMAHTLIRDVVGDLRKEYSKRDLRVAAKIVEQTTDAICNNLFFVGPELN